MAKKSTKKPAKRAPSKATSSESTNVTRITASDKGSTKSKKSAAKAQKSETKSRVASERISTAPSKRSRKNPLSAIRDYFSGAWYELRQVRWPDRPTTWAMTGALLGFTVFFVIVILLLDALFQYLFNITIG